MNIHPFKTIRILPVLFCIAAFFFFSCKDDEGENSKSVIDGKLKPYLDLFLKEGKARGRLIDIEKAGGLIMEFADLTPPAIGVCYSSKPIRVQIDKTYWEATLQSANQENLREELVFHELGHGLLNRGHTNTILENDEWKSMMCGEPQVYGRNWCLNFNGYRKNYYLDELFNPNTPAPAWSNQAVFDGNKGDFLLKQEAYERIKQNSSSSNILEPLFGTIVPFSTDFYIEVDLKLRNGEFSGIFAGNSNIDNYDYFTVDRNNRSLANNKKCLVPFAEIMLGDKYQHGAYNKLAISKRGDELFFYINDQLIYRNDYKIPEYNTLGVIVPAQGSVSIKNFALYSEENAILKSTKPVENQEVVSVALPEIKFFKQ